MVVETEYVSLNRYVLVHTVGFHEEAAHDGTTGSPDAVLGNLEDALRRRLESLRGNG